MNSMKIIENLDPPAKILEKEMQSCMALWF